MLKDLILDFDSGRAGVKYADVTECEGSWDSEEVVSLVGVSDTTEASLDGLMDMFRNIRKLRLDNSVITSMRDIGSGFLSLRFVSLASCGISSLDGISALSPCLEELYLPFNWIEDVSDLMGMDSLRVLDLRSNRISDISGVAFLTCCENLKVLTLAANPLAMEDPYEYKKKVLELVPNLEYLDEQKPKLGPPPPDAGPSIRRQIAGKAKQKQTIREPEPIQECNQVHMPFEMEEDGYEDYFMGMSSSDNELVLSDLPCTSHSTGKSARGVIFVPRISKKGRRPHSSVADKEA
jgi:hypothetical protein